MTWFQAFKTSVKSRGRPKRSERIRARSTQSENFCSVLSKKMRGRWALGRNRSAVQGTTKASGATSFSIPNSTGKTRSNDHHHTRWELGKKGDAKSDQTTSNEYHDTKHQAAGEQEKHDDCFSENPILPQRHGGRVLAHSTNDDVKTSTG